MKKNRSRMLWEGSEEYKRRVRVLVRAAREIVDQRDATWAHLSQHTRDHGLARGKNPGGKNEPIRALRTALRALEGE